MYYPTGNDSRDIRRLNTATGEFETVKRLQFQPKSLIAQDGWVCCGGENGEFSAIYLDGVNDEIDSDARLPLDPASRFEDVALSSSMQTRTTKSLFAKSKSFGKERVNCVTLWMPPTLAPRSEGIYDQPVAVLANNDKVAYIVTLQDQRVVDQVRHPDCVNRAVLSPNGRLLAVICDDPYLYVHERVENHSARRSSARDPPVCSWKQCARIFLKSQSKDDRSDNRGSFAICFSNTGKYLAVGTQYGVISIFDPSKFAAENTDPLITCFTTTRPNTDSGAVRDMAFAPGPLDLLAWTEDRGRVGIADIRRGFSSRQLLYLDKVADYEHVTVKDITSIETRPGEARHDRHDTLSSSFANTLDLSLEARRSRLTDGVRTLAERYSSPLTADETAVLEALQGQRRRHEQRVAASTATGSSNSRPQPSTPPRVTWTERNTRSAIWGGSRPRDREASVSRAVDDVLGNIRDQRDRVRDNQERVMASMREETQQSLRALDLTAEEQQGLRAMMTNAEEPLRAAARSAGGVETRSALQDEAEERLQQAMMSAPRGWQRPHMPLNNNRDRVRTSGPPTTRAWRSDFRAEPTRAVGPGVQGIEDRSQESASGRTSTTRRMRDMRDSTLERLRASLNDDAEERLRAHVDHDQDEELRSQMQDAAEERLQTAIRRDVQERPRERQHPLGLRSNVRNEIQSLRAQVEDFEARANELQSRLQIRERLQDTRPDDNEIATVPAGSRSTASGQARRSISGTSALSDRISSRVTGTGTGNPDGIASGGWADLQALYQLSLNTSTEVGANRDDAFRAALESDARRTWTENMGESRRELSMRDWADAATRRVPRTQYLSREPRPDPHDTSGLSWSDDGQFL